jgi:O-antigen ligase
MQQNQLTNNCAAKSFATWMLYFTALISPAVCLFSGAAVSLIFIFTALAPVLLLLQNPQKLSLKIRMEQFFYWFLSTPIKRVITAFLAFSLISVAWTIESDNGFNIWCRLFLAFIGAMALFEFLKGLNQEQRESLGKCLLIGFILALCAANIEIISDGVIDKAFYSLKFLYKKEHIYNLTDLNRGASYISMLFWPLLAYLLLRKQKLLAVGLFIITLATLLRMESQSSWVAMICASFATLFICFTGKKGLNIIMVIAVIAVPMVAITAKIADPAKIFADVPHIPNSASEYRVYIWNFTAQKAYEKAIFGWGLDSSRSIPVKDSDYFLGGRYPLPMHPHNNVLQMWLELGIVGILLFIAFVLSILQTIKNIESPDSSHCETNPALRNEKPLCNKIGKLFEQNLVPALFLGITANYFVIGEIGYGIWQTWWISCVTFAIIFMRITALRK